MTTRTSTWAYATSRLLAGLVVVVPVSIWELLPRDENGVAGPGLFYLTVGSGVVLAAVAARATRWRTRAPLVAAGIGWLVVLGVQGLADLTYDGDVGIGDGAVALLGLAAVPIATFIAMLTPLRASSGE